MSSRTHSVADDRLKSFIERIEHLDEERTSIATGIREVFAEAKADGYDTKVMRKVVALRKMDVGERNEQEELLDLYKRALGIQGRLFDAPLVSVSMATNGDSRPAA